MSPPTWTPLQRRLHWIVALLVASQFALQGAMRAANEAARAGDAVTFGQFAVTTLHTWGGAGVALLVAWRLVLRRRAPVPVARGALGPRASRLVAWHHRALYALLALMALSGALHWYVGWEAAARWHETGKWALAGAVAVHLAGAAVHARRGGGGTARDAILQDTGSEAPERSD